MTNIIVFGDSIAWGAYDQEKGGWVERLRLRLAPHDIDVYNCGVSGNRTADLLKRLENEAKARSGRENVIIMIAIGINDATFIRPLRKNEVSKEDFEKNLTQIYRKALQITKSVIAMGLIKIDDSKTRPLSWDTGKELRDADAQAYERIAQQVSGQAGIPFIAVRDLLKPSDLYDGLHPNSKGHNKIFKEVEGFLKKGKYLESAFIAKTHQI